MPLPLPCARLRAASLTIVATAVVLLAPGAPARATATVIGVATGSAGSGACPDTHAVQLVDPASHSDHLTLAASAACLGGMFTAAATADATKPSVGIGASAYQGPLKSAQAAAFVSLTDQLLITLPSATPLSSLTDIPVSFHLDGTVSSDALISPSFGRYLDYNLSITDSSTIQGLQTYGKVTSNGAFHQTWNGTLSVYHSSAAGTPDRATIEMTLFVPQIDQGVIDFYHTGSLEMLLPAGVTVTTSSGVPILFGSTSPVPEPDSALMLLTGLCVVGAVARRKLTRGLAA